MDNLETAFLSGGTVGIFGGVIIFLLRCLQKKKLLSKCCGSELSISDEQQEKPQIIQISSPITPHSTPVLESRRASTTAVVNLKLDEESKV